MKVYKNQFGIPCPEGYIIRDIVLNVRSSSDDTVKDSTSIVTLGSWICNEHCPNCHYCSLDGQEVHCGESKRTPELPFEFPL